MPPAPPTADSILVRAPNWAGDVVMCTPAFRALRARYPRARIVAQVREGLEPLLRGGPWFDAVETLPAALRGPRALWRAGRALRKREGGFDLGLCLPESFSSAWLMRAAGVRRIVGYRRDGRGLLLHQGVRAPRAWGRRRRVARERFALHLLETLGCPPRGTDLELFVTPAEAAAASTLLAQAGSVRGERLAALAPGASYGPSKLWPAERFAVVGDLLAAQGFRVAILGSACERPLAARVVAAMRLPASDWSGAVDLGGAKALLARASVLVCNDAGLRHVAVALGVPAVVLMGPTDLAKTALNLDRVRVLEGSAACRPCYLRSCPIDHRCLTSIAPEPVAEAALALTGAEAGRGA